MTKPKPPKPKAKPKDHTLYPQEWWMANGKCVGLDPNIFFPPDGHNLLSRQAIEICNTCPVQLRCLEYALDHRIDDGVWGGTTRNERRRIRRGRKTLRDLGLDNNGLRLASREDPPPQSAHG